MSKDCVFLFGGFLSGEVVLSHTLNIIIGFILVLVTFK